jgi:hypothetical protein
MKSLSKEEEFLPKSHFVMQAKGIIEKEFTKQIEGDYTNVEIIFGIQGIDKASVKWWDPNGIGEPIWDQIFDITDTET